MADLTLLTAIHTALSLVALVAGMAAVMRLFGQALPPYWTPLFLVTAVATSATGFLFPFTGPTPAFVTGIIALLVLAPTLAARHVFGAAGPWRAVQAVGIVASEYLLVFVAIAQAFMKVPLLHPLAPTLSEPPFAVAQVLALALFLWLGWRAGRQAGPRLLA